jgi:hypothetical protein
MLSGESMEKHPKRRFPTKLLLIQGLKQRAPLTFEFTGKQSVQIPQIETIINLHSGLFQKQRYIAVNRMRTSGHLQYHNNHA